MVDEYQPSPNSSESRVKTPVITQSAENAISFQS